VGRIDGKVCAVTGAGRGIGRACALRLAEEGGHVACGDVLEDTAAAAEIRAAGGSAGAFRVDVTDEASVAAFYAGVAGRFGGVHVLVNNAGVLLAGDGSVVDTELAAWQRVLDVNLTGVFLCCKHGIPRLLDAGGGSVVNIASIFGLIGSADSQIGYAASKGGVIAMTRDIAVELARRGVRANAVCPGPVETPLVQVLYTDDEAWQRRRIHLPAGRLARPQEIADAVLFLASDESSFVNGSAFAVDGGTSVAYTTPED